MRLLLDTATLIYAVQFPERLSRRASRALHNLDNALELSAVSVTEIAIKSASGKLAFSFDALQRALQDLDMRILPYNGEHALHMFDLPFHHRDPFDRQIIAQLLAEQIPIATPDRKFREYEGVTVIW
jgi:PIN domain nuclease of toxin-antitoxin system